MTDFHGLKLGSSDLSELDFSGTNLSDITFTSTNLTSSNFTGANLSDGDLTSANLTNANLTNTILLDTTLTGSTLTNCTLDNTIISRDIINTSADVNYGLFNAAVGPLTISSALSLSNKLGDEMILVPSYTFNSIEPVLSMSADGTVVGVVDNFGSISSGQKGIVFIFKYSSLSNTWSQMGSPIEGPSDTSRQGYSGESLAVAFSENGTRVVLGAYTDGDNDGAVRVFEYDGSDWNQLGSSIVGSGNMFGTGATISLDGTTIVTGAFEYSNGVDKGLLQVYEYTGSSWVQKGGDIYGTDVCKIGAIVAINTDKTIIGSVGIRGENVARIYEYSGSAWTQKGSDIATTGNSAHSISFDASGTRVMIGDPENSQIKIHDFTTNWNLHSTINGTPFGGFGRMGSLLSDDGLSIFANGDFLSAYAYNGSSWEQLGADIVSSDNGLRGTMNKNMDVMVVRNVAVQQTTMFAYKPIHVISS